ncbi:unnamed protein product [Schistosoma bovis]|nr:unnamed protein product [Schistosoma bovis]
MSKVKVGIIGGSGFDDPNLFKKVGVRQVTTPFGKPSDALIEGFVGDVACVVLPRHGKGHLIPPSEVNYRANVWALRDLGCTHILATNACGSLQEDLVPGDFVVLNQFLDKTWGRENTFYGSKPDSLKGVLHMPMAEPFCERTRQVNWKCLKWNINKPLVHCVLKCAFSNDQDFYKPKNEPLTIV